ncbi:DNRLRE domain-containing protein [Brevibacillus nitrificans]|uniref:DNRLRE domain-containing protein n=1 Tax=Brevibacillus nitrificans TaxID=651560 RepID=A0A3M8DML6_9BACL|nr:Ig-like domain-containing protein [Brevibacillus nitrificans]RNB88751.1 DNRLRE domain-containing protein [Brevibacillus nitrificans]
MKRMIARLLVFFLLFSILQHVFIQEKGKAADLPDVIQVEADKFADNYGAYPDGLYYDGEPNTLMVGYARDQGGDYGPENAALRFDLNGVKTDKKIESATLQIYVYKVETTGGDVPFIDLWGSFDDNWEDDAYQILPSYHERIISNEMLPSTFTGWKSFDVTSFVKSNISDKKATFVLRGRQTAPPVPLFYQPQIVFYDKRNASYASRLVITYVSNTPPTDILVTPGSLPENNAIGAVVGTLSAIDPDPGDTFTFRIQNPSVPFTIEGNQLKATQSFDYEAGATYLVPITATDSAGNAAAKVLTIQVTDVDEPPTTASVIINGGAGVTNSADVTLVMTHDDPDAAEPQYRLSNVEDSQWSVWKPFESPVTWSLSAGEGTKTVFMELRDGTGTVLKAQDRIVLDTTPPTGMIEINNGILATSTERVELTVQGSDANGPVEVMLSNDNGFTGSWIPLPTNNKLEWNLTGGDGEKTVYAKFRDGAGNVFSTSDTIVLDKTPPVVSGITHNGIYAVDVIPVFNEGTATLNGAVFVNGTKVSAEGTYTLRVTDGVGNTTTIGFTLDKTAPSGSLKINGDANFTNAMAATLQISVTDTSDELQMRFSPDTSDPANWTSWEAVTATKAWSLPTGDGVKTVSMEVKDKAGNTASFFDEIILDMTNPIGSFEINQGNTFTNASDVTLSVESADAHAVEMRLSNDNLTWSQWYAAPARGDVPWKLDGADGTKTVYLELRDLAGNQIALQKQITLDANGPVVTGVSQDGVYQNDVTIVFNEGTATLNGDPFTSGSLVSGEGRYELVVTDTAQNRTTIQFTLDKTPPTGSFSINRGAEFTKSEDVTLLFASPDADDIEMAVSNTDDNTGTWEPFAESKAWKLADGTMNGSKTVYVKLRDKAGNITKLSDTIELDVVAPSGSLSINNGDPHTKSRDVVLTVTASDSTSDVQVRFANGDNDWSAWEAVSASKAWQLEAGDGHKTVDMQMTDKAGNITTVSDTIELDGEAPVVTGVEDKGVYKDDVTITYNEGTATLNGSPFSSGEAVTSEGKHELVAQDASGNETRVIFTVDKTPPTGSFVINQNDRLTYSTSVKLQVTASDNVSDVGMRVSNENGKWSSWEKVKGTVPWTLTNGNGTKKVLIQLRDEAGHTTDLDDSIELYVPHVPNPPTPPATNPVTGVELDEEELTLRVGETETLHAIVKPGNATDKRVKWESSDSEIVQVDGEGKVTAAAPGTATITVRTVDGNKTDSVEVTVKEIATFQLEASEPSYWLKPGGSTYFRLYKVEGKKRKLITSDKQVVYDTANGLVTVKQGRMTAGKKAGEDLITIRYMGEELEIPVTVTKSTIRSLSTSLKDLVLEKEQEKQLSLTANFTDEKTEEVTRKATWSSSDEAVIEVTKEGKVRAKATGKAVITAKYGGKKVSSRVLVVKEKKVQDLRASRTSLRLKADRTGEIVLYAIYENNYQEIVTSEAKWTVEDPEIASVEEGVVTALESGETTIAVEYEGETITIQLKVW